MTSTIKTKIETITPEQAETMLEAHNPRNRRLSLARVDKYAAEMKRGHWVLNGEPIIIDDSEDIIDGQHRIAAIKECKIPLTTLVVRGVPTNYNNGIKITTQDTIDRGASRTVGDQLGMAHGIKNGVAVAATARAIAQFCTGAPQIRLSTCQTLEVLKLYGKHVEGVLEWIGVPRQRVAYVLAPFSLFRAVNLTKAEEFVARYISLENLTAKHPILALRRWIDNHDNCRNDEARMRGMKAVCSAIQHFMNGNTISHLYASDEAYGWMLAQHKANARKIGELIA